MATLPTVRIKHPSLEGETLLINEADFDAEKHEKAGAKKPSRKPSKGSAKKGSSSKS